MKYVLIIFCFISFFSCRKNTNLSLEPLKTDAIDDIPFLMTQMKLDSIFEVVTFGQINNLNVNDTLNYYWLTDKNVVSHKFRGFMCCTYTYVYDTSDLLTSRTKFSDYSEYFISNYARNEDRIFETEKSNLGTAIQYKYDIKNELLMSKTGASKSKTAHIETSTYNYNSKKQLAIKTSKTKSNDHNSGIDYSKTIVLYSWAEAILSATNEKNYYPNGIDYFETITKFDSEGFPASKIIKKNRDTICKTIIKRF